MKLRSLGQVAPAGWERQVPLGGVLINVDTEVSQM